MNNNFQQFTQVQQNRPENNDLLWIVYSLTDKHKLKNYKNRYCTLLTRKCDRWCRIVYETENYCDFTLFKNYQLRPKGCRADKKFPVASLSLLITEPTKTLLGDFVSPKNV